MTMHSMELLPQLQGLPVDEPRQRMSFRDAITGLVSTDRAMFAAEFAAAASFGMWAIFPGVNVDDDLRETMVQAHERAFPGEDRAVYEHWQDVEALNDSVAMNNTFMSPLKGAVAEINAKEQLNENGWNVDLAPGSTQPGWDLYGTDPTGNYTQIQVKTGTSYDAGDIQEHMDRYPVGDVNYADHYAMGSEIHEKYMEFGLDAGGRTLTDIGPDLELVDGTTDGLNTLSANMGIDIPDGLVDIIPFAIVIVGSARLIYSVLRTEREFKAADRTTKNQIQVVQTLTLMSKMGVSVVLATAGGAAGGAAGTAVPGVGNAIGMTGGSLAGAGMGMYLNKHLQPHMLDLALNITGLTRDDLFYYKNKPRINELASTFQRKAGELAAAPGL